MEEKICKNCIYVEKSENFIVSYFCTRESPLMRMPAGFKWCSQYKPALNKEAAIKFLSSKGTTCKDCRHFAKHNNNIYFCFLHDEEIEDFDICEEYESIYGNGIK
jgi:hypothetical protein